MLKFGVTPVAKYRSVTARRSSGGTLRRSLVSCRCILGPTLFSSNSNDCPSVKSSYMLSHQALATEHDAHHASICSLGTVASTSFFFFFSFLASQQLMPSHKPQLFHLYRLPCLFWYWYQKSCNWYQFLVPVSGQYVMGITTVQRDCAACDVQYSSSSCKDASGVLQITRSNTVIFAVLEAYVCRPYTVF